MATVKHGTTTPAPARWRHLRRLKRFFWKQERQAVKKEASKQTLEAQG